MNRNYYVIAGCDLTPFRTDKYEDWKWTKEGENMTNNQRKGYIQFFDDPMDGSYLYLGHVLADGDEYDFPTVKIGKKTVDMYEPYILDKIKQLVIDGVLPATLLTQDLKYEIIIFEETTPHSRDFSHQLGVV